MTQPPLDDETKWFDPIRGDLTAAISGVNFEIWASGFLYKKPVVVIEWNGDDADGDDVVAAMSKYEGKIELILECSPSRKDLKEIEAALSQAASDGDLPF